MGFRHFPFCRPEPNYWTAQIYGLNVIMGLLVGPSMIRPNYWADRIPSQEIRVGLGVSVFLLPQTTATSRQSGFGVALEVGKLADFGSPSSFHMELVGEAEQEEEEEEEELFKRRAARSYANGKKKRGWKYGNSSFAPINNLDDGCLMHIFSFLSPIPDRYNTALVCHRWHYLACHPLLWLRVDRSIKSLSEPGVFPTIESAVSAARPGDTILIGAGGKHLASDIKIQKPLCLIGGGELPDETTLVCSRGSDSALELFSTCKLANLTVRAELGSCLLHRSGRLTIDGCVLQCESNPLDYLSYPIVSTADGVRVIPSSLPSNGNGVYVSRTRIEGGAKAVLTNGDLALQRVRVIYGRTSIFFWFDVECQS